MFSAFIGWAMVKAPTIAGEAGDEGAPSNSVAATAADTNASAAGPAEPGQRSASAARAYASPRLLLAPQLSELIQSVRAGTNTDGLVARIHQSGTNYQVSPAQLVYLRDLGLPTPVLLALAQAQGPSQAPAGARRLPADILDPMVPRPQAVYVPAPAPVPPFVSLLYFYESLSPYGQWLSVPGYGACWQPTAALLDAEWQPYGSFGYWVWSDVGWYWNSGYAWGWIPFHYGRWAKHPSYGWLWQPDMEWGPAWVSWRIGSKYSGWAPLPPGADFGPDDRWTYFGRGVGRDYSFGLPASAFVFVPYDQLTKKWVFTHRLGLPLAQSAFEESEVDNNYTLGFNDLVANLGPNPQLLLAAAAAPNQRAAVIDREGMQSTVSGGGGPVTGMGASMYGLPGEQGGTGVPAYPPTQSVTASPWSSAVGVNGNLIVAPAMLLVLPVWTIATGAPPVMASAPAANNRPGNSPPTGNSATPWLPVDQPASAGKLPPYGVPGVPIVPNDGKHPYLPVGQQAATGNLPPYGVPGVPIVPNNGKYPYLPVGQQPATGNLPPYGVPGVPIVPNNGKYPYLPVGQQPATGNLPPYGVAGVPIVPNNGKNPYLPVGQQPGQSGLPPFGTATLNTPVSGFAANQQVNQGAWPLWPNWPTTPNWPNTPQWPTTANWPTSPTWPSWPNWPTSPNWPTAPNWPSWPSWPNWPTQPTQRAFSAQPMTLAAQRTLPAARMLSAPSTLPAARMLPAARTLPTVFRPPVAAGKK